jgi:hypothetical protein
MPEKNHLRMNLTNYFFMIEKDLFSMIHVTIDSHLSPRHIVHMLLSTPSQMWQ